MKRPPLHSQTQWISPILILPNFSEATFGAVASLMNIVFLLVYRDITIPSYGDTNAFRVQTLEDTKITGLSEKKNSKFTYTISNVLIYIT